ncbi:MAG: RNA 2',3'-cyclic phosphodiesterase [Deltaproteobacteria bacterium]|nr:RNA 2',3'-cyclic phosphodiesterase [Deltaproteobacteria bacterium]
MAEAKFLENIEENRIEEIEKKMEQAVEGITPFRLWAEGVGAFPNLSSPRVIWVGIKAEDNNPLPLLQRGLEEELSMLGFEREDRTFHPHLTIGRIKYLEDKKHLVDGLRGLADTKVGEFWVEGITLFKSELKPTGAVYTKLKEVRLKSSQ